jgi:hypothetical protein
MAFTKNILFCCFLLTGCAGLEGMDSLRSDYDSYLHDNLQEQKLFTKLKESASARFLEITPHLSKLQSDLVPGFEQKALENQTLFVVSLELPEWARFSISDFKFIWGEEKSKSVKEVHDPHLLQSFYPFAVPHDRVFVVEFPKPLSRPSSLKVQTSQGQFVFKTEESKKVKFK